MTDWMCDSVDGWLGTWTNVRVVGLVFEWMGDWAYG